MGLRNMLVAHGVIEQNMAGNVLCIKLNKLNDACN